MTDRRREELQQLLTDIDEALPSEKHRTDFRRRLAEVPIAEGVSKRYLAVSLRLAWQTKGGVAPTLAQRVHDLMDRLDRCEPCPRPIQQRFTIDGITKRPSPTKEGPTRWPTK